MSRKKNKFEIAGMKIAMVTEYERTLRQAQDYLADENAWEFEEADGIIEFPEGFIEEKQAKEFPRLTLEHVEYLCTGSMFYRILLKAQGMLVHSSAVVVDGYAYLFSADSGTGKSTHTGLWVEHFKDRAFIINDDKPALRKMDGKWYVYGTPWSGKTDMNVNTKAELGGIVFLERAKENWIADMSPVEAVPKLIAQTTRKLYKESNMDLLLKNINELLCEVPLYKMGCNISDEAVVTAYEKIRRV